MTNRSNKTAQELEAALIKALKTHPECNGVARVKLTRLDDSLGLANWDAEFEAAPGTTMSPNCKRVLLGAKQGIQKLFDLAGED